MTRVRAARAAVTAVLLGLATGCATAPPQPRLEPLPESVRPFLPAPGATLGAAAGGRWDPLHARLLAGVDPVAVADEVARMAAGGIDDGGRLLLAEAQLAGGRPADAFRTLGGMTVAARTLPPVRLLEARAREQAGDLVEAYSLYRQLAPGVAAAAVRARALEAEAVTVLRGRVADALARGRGQEAARDLDRLRAWRPHDRETLAAARAVAAATGDRAGELGALRALAAGGTLPTADELRLAELELETGESDRALARIEALAAAQPDVPAIAAALDRARFRWRLSHAPEPVQQAAAQPVLTRAQFAQLLYWLFPGVRSGRGGAARIASDVVGHPAQEEIVRAVNLGLLRVDETLHRFEPDRPLRRLDALEATLRAAAVRGEAPACARETLASGGRREAVCAGAVACGLVAEPAECLLGGEVAGREALEWIRAALAGIGAE